MQRIRVGDEVIAVAGSDKGRAGKVSQLFRDKTHTITHAIVDGLKIVKKAVKPNPNSGVKGGIVEKEARIHISNIALVNPNTGKADRVFLKQLADGTKVRCFKSNSEMVDL